MEYDQTVMTLVQASAVTPESKAITERPAISSQKTKETSASSCEIINQMRMGRREAGWVSKAISYKWISQKQSAANFTRVQIQFQT